MSIMNRTKIESFTFTWNPVTGCRHDCFYCYVPRLHNYELKPYFHPKRLPQPLKIRKPSSIFCGSTTDPMGDWLPVEWIHEILKIIYQCPQHTFYFLTKNPKRYVEFEFPDNCILGTTIESQFPSFRAQELIDATAHRNNKLFVCFEPLLSDIQIDMTALSWIIIGAMTGPEADKYRPKREWIEHLVNQAQELNIPIFMKTGKEVRLADIWGPDLIQEFPNQKVELKEEQLTLI